LSGELATFITDGSFAFFSDIYFVDDDDTFISLLLSFPSVLVLLVYQCGIGMRHTHSSVHSLTGPYISWARKCTVGRSEPVKCCWKLK